MKNDTVKEINKMLQEFHEQNLCSEMVSVKIYELVESDLFVKVGMINLDDFLSEQEKCSF